MDKEKGPVDLFPTEPTDEGTCAEETLNPHARNEHKILSLARLPVPTLPRGVLLQATK